MCLRFDVDGRHTNWKRRDRVLNWDSIHEVYSVPGMISSSLIHSTVERHRAVGLWVTYEVTSGDVAEWKSLAQQKSLAHHEEVHVNVNSPQDMAGVRVDTKDVGRKARQGLGY